MGRLFLAVATVVPLGCAGTSVGYDRAYVGRGIAEASGYQLARGTAPGQVFSPPILLEDGLTEDEAVQLALWNNAALHEDLAQLGFTRADLIQAGLLTNPVFSILYPLGPKQLEFTLTVPLEALLLRPRRVEAARWESARVAEGLVQNGLNTIRDVRRAYADLMLAQDRAALAEQTLALRQRILDLAEARFEAGDVSELDVITVRADRLLAEQEAERASYDAALAGEALRTLLGLGFADTPIILDDRPALPLLDGGIDVLLATALAARPDLRSAEIAVEAARQRLQVARWDWLRISGIYDANGPGDQGFESGPGTELEIPLFDRNQGGMARAEAQLEQAVRRYVTVRDRVALEVRQAHLRYVQSLDTLEGLQSEIVPALESALTRSERAYELGETSLLLVLETTRQLVDARAREVEAEADVRRAWAELERSAGARLPSVGGGVEPRRPVRLPVSGRPAVGPLQSAVPVAPEPTVAYAVASGNVASSAEFRVRHATYEPQFSTELRPTSPTPHAPESPADSPRLSSDGAGRSGLSSPARVRDVAR